MNIFDLDKLGTRLVELDHQDELYNCTAQLVMAANALLSDPFTRIAGPDSPLGQLRAALQPFLQDSSSLPLTCPQCQQAWPRHKTDCANRRKDI